MAKRIFHWGTVKDTLYGALFDLGRGIWFDLTIKEAQSAGRQIKSQRYNSTGLVVVLAVATSPGQGLWIRMEWDPYPTTPKSALKVGYCSNSAIRRAWALGMTPTILSHDEAMEFADALLAVKPSQTAKVAQTIP